MRLLPLFATLFSLAAPAASAAVIYDGSAGAPGTQGWFSFVPGGVETFQSDHVNVNTGAGIAIQAGYARLEPGLLTSSPGFRLDFTLELVNEDHGSVFNRSGFSVIVTDQSLHGIELAFWKDAIWAQDLNFVHGKEIAFTTTALTHYSLTVVGGSYSLIAGSGPLTKVLSGTTLSYDADGLPFPFQNVPYRTPSLLFLGDDTKSASASFNLHSVSLAPVPEPATMAMLAAGLALLAFTQRVRRRR